MDKTAKVRLLQLIETGEISVDELKEAQNEDLHACGRMFIREAKGYISKTGYFNDEEFEALFEKIEATNRRRNLLGLPEICSLVVTDSTIDVNYAELKSADEGTEEVDIIHIPGNRRDN